MNSKLRWTLLTAISMVCFISASSQGIAISVTTTPSQQYTYNQIAGSSHLAKAVTDIPFASVKWYVDGALKETDNGNGSLKTAYFSYTFSGSTSGRQYEIKAIAFDSQSSSDTDAYDLTVWSRLDDTVAPVSKTVSKQLQVGESYLVSFSMTTPNSNYLITGAEVSVDGTVVASQNYSDVTSAKIAAFGSLSTRVGHYVTVSVKWSWKILPKAYIGKWFLKKTWQAAIRSRVYGQCTCYDDGNPLDSSGITFSGDYYDNSTTVEWDAGSQGGKRSETTSVFGNYTFTDVPCGYKITMTVVSTDYHLHGSGPYPLKRCEYSEEAELGEVGQTVWFTGLHWSPDTIERDFALVPDTVEDP